MGELFLAHGVTTVKDLGNVVEWISAVSADVEQGRMRGPRIFYVGNGLDAPPPARETHVGIDSPETARHAVRLLHSRGASAIKIREKATIELVKAITEEAHKLGIPVTGHIRRIDAREAALAGIDGLEHASGIVQAIANRPKETEPSQDPLQSFISDLKAFGQIESAKIDELARLLASKKVALVPSMAGWWRMATERRDDFAREDAEYAKNQSLVYVPDDVRKLWATSAIYNLKNAEDLAQIKLGFKKLQHLLITHYQAGGKVLAASDTFNFVPGLSLQRELILLVDAGFTPLQAITIGTRDNAQFLGRGAELGSIATGKWADIVVVNANPLDNIRNISQVSIVIKDGQVVDTSYHADYAIPTPKPKIVRPVWLEKKLQKNENTRAPMR
jgi:imidazolonepropionase-like amidohydrolase